MKILVYAQHLEVGGTQVNAIDPQYLHADRVLRIGADCVGA